MKIRDAEIRVIAHDTRHRRAGGAREWGRGGWVVWTAVCIPGCTASEGRGWVEYMAQVGGTARVGRKAVVCDRAEVSDNAHINNSLVYGSARVSDNAVIRNSSVRENSAIFGNARVVSSTINGNARIWDSTEVRNSVVTDNGQVSGSAIVKGSTISGNGKVNCGLWAGIFVSTDRTGQCGRNGNDDPLGGVLSNSISPGNTESN